MDIDRIKEEASGRWHGIMNTLGIQVGNGRHCACPVCGGKDRFRFTDKDGKGCFICNQCGAGDGFHLVQKYLKVDFIGACKEVEKVVGSCERINHAQEPMITKEQLRKIFNTSQEATDRNLVGKYLHNRGLKVVPKVLRSSSKCWCSERKGEFPAMLAVFHMQDGTAITMHRTYVTGYGDKADVEQVKKMLPALGKISGGCVRLFDIAEHMAIAEGVENAIAVHEDTGLPALASTTAVLLERFEPPEGIKHLSIFADNDKNFTGQKAAYNLANRLAINHKDLIVDVFVPPRPGEDWLDILNKQGV